TWAKVEGGAPSEAIIDDIIKKYSLAGPELSVPALVNLYKALQGLKDNYWKTQKMQEVQRLIEICSGLWMEATSGNEMAVQGDSIKVNISVNNRLGANLTLTKISMDAI